VLPARAAVTAPVEAIPLSRAYGRCGAGGEDAAADFGARRSTGCARLAWRRAGFRFARCAGRAARGAGRAIVGGVVRGLAAGAGVPAGGGAGTDVGAGAGARDTGAGVAGGGGDVAGACGAGSGRGPCAAGAGSGSGLCARPVAGASTNTAAAHSQGTQRPAFLNFTRRGVKSSALLG